jgi:hypothetical protein
MGECYFCHKPASETHHCLHGTANRKLADLYCLTEELCLKCHRRLHGKDGHSMDLQLKQAAQRQFERAHGHEAWMQIFRRNYL